ncbi:hypothetical protein Mth01_39950 [Sphaerimonospora thailandensis]|uniref:Uncharacterized protein n=1 Tax=Sphaerimonospora thailandensis TaxID=795644 RepID=A0A8J3RDA1_9ACTN|nr:hypothetical protein Mth01_39950 [Sphaerimonospora thailandensis]
MCAFGGASGGGCGGGAAVRAVACAAGGAAGVPDAVGDDWDGSDGGSLTQMGDVS